MSLTLAKKRTNSGEGFVQADLAGAWGFVDMSAGGGEDIAVFSSVITIDAEGNAEESGTTGLFTSRNFQTGNIRVEADALDAAGGSASVTTDGIVTLGFDGGNALGYISADAGLIYFGGSDGCCVDSAFGNGTAETAFGVPLGAGVTAADLDRKSFEFVGLAMGFEGALTTSEGFSGFLGNNYYSNAGTTMSFALNGENLEATLGGSSDLGIFNTNFSGGALVEYAVEVKMNDPNDGTFPVSVADNGAISIRVNGEPEIEDDADLLIQGFLDANGRLALSFVSGNAGVLNVLDQARASGDKSAVEDGFDFINAGFLLGVPVN